jgi:hypothetical protein
MDKVVEDEPLYRLSEIETYAEEMVFNQRVSTDQLDRIWSSSNTDFDKAELRKILRNDVVYVALNYAYLQCKD